MAFSLSVNNLSVLNLFFINYVYWSKSYFLYPMCICNTSALTLTWYSSILFVDCSLPKRMIEKFGWNILIYIMGEIMLHIMPCLFIRHIYNDFHKHKHLLIHHQLIYVHHAGLYSLLFCYFFAVVFQNGFALNEVYVNLQPFQWNILWSINALSHIGTMFWLNQF